MGRLEGLGNAHVRMNRDVPFSSLYCVFVERWDGRHKARDKRTEKMMKIS